MANRHHIEPCCRTEAAATRLSGFPFNASMILRSLT
jgi:hypothetical protein